jgi:hypothetical protein
VLALKLETRFKKAMAEENPNIRLSKLESICLMITWHGSIWSKAMEEAKKLREQGYKYW